MRKILLIHVAVILVVLVVISPLAFLETKGKTVETINGVTQNNGEFLSLNLLIGQTVSGSCAVNYDAKLINFFIIDPQGKATEIKPTYRDNTGWAFFSFTAIMDGRI